jgi:peptidoglycan/xylan/chitin deacetylase (PgdA/CDA1 family)
MLLKRLIKLVVSLGVGAFDALNRVLRHALGKPIKPRCVVLYYHAVDSAQRRRFGLQMDQVLRFTRPVTSDGPASWEPGRRYSALTFDDGFVSVVENALPEIERRNIPATLFVPTGCLGSRPAWVKNPAAPGFRQKVASREQLAGLSRHPLLCLASHSVSHPNFLGLEPHEADQEFRESRRKLEEICGKAVALFSFPHGAHNAELVRMAMQAGYRRVFTVEPKWAFNAPGETVVGRVAVDPADWMIEFRLKLLGAYRWMAALG